MCSHDEIDDDFRRKLGIKWPYYKRQRLCKKLQWAYKQGHKTYMKDQDDPATEGIPINNPNKLENIKFPKCLKPIKKQIINSYKFSKNSKDIKLFKKLFGLTHADLKSAYFINNPNGVHNIIREIKKRKEKQNIKSQNERKEATHKYSNKEVQLVNVNYIPGKDNVKLYKRCKLIKAFSLQGLKRKAFRNKDNFVIGVQYNGFFYMGTAIRI